MSRFFLVQKTDNTNFQGWAAKSVAAAQNTTFFLAKSSQQLSDSPRHPVDLEGVPESCAGCHLDKGDEDETLLECEKVCFFEIKLLCDLEKKDIFLTVRRAVSPVLS